MPKTCRNCGKPFVGSLLGLRAFCSEDCRKAYRRRYQREYLKAARGDDNKKTTSYMDSPFFDNRRDVTPRKQMTCGGLEAESVTRRCSEKFMDYDWRAVGGTIHCARCEEIRGESKKGSEKKAPLALDDFGGKEWYLLAKDKCCNFDLRNREGYCVTLSSPYRIFRIACSDCSLAKALALRTQRTTGRRGQRSLPLPSII